MSTPDDLRPRERELVFLLWNGLSLKQAASAMHISYHTASKYVTEVGQRLGGTCGPLQRIMLWQAELLRTNPAFFPLSPPPPPPTLAGDARNLPSGDAMR